MQRYAVACFAFSVCLAGFVPTTAVALAAPPGAVPSAAAGDADDSDADDSTAVPERSAGEIDGKVAEVDYHGERLVVAVPWPNGKKRYAIVVMPSTTIIGRGRDFYEISDIKKGAHISVLLSLKAGTYIAQIIHLR